MATHRILGITGSLRKASYNTALLRTVIGKAPASLVIEPADLAGIPIYNGDDEKALGPPAAVTALSDRIRAAAAVIIVTPEYNFSIPGPLKNGLDWISRPKDQPFKDKPVGIMGASDGPVGTARSQYHVRQVLVSLQAVTMTKPEVLLTNAPSKFDAEGTLTDQPTLEVIGRWLKAFEAWVDRMAA
ncbi:MAG TPA: NAD(P)H-dependent oxidoreductase [Aestuariivirgaceae bacterium]|nr:NAD(P)H-dependent oxidoreductase [Aestuariivirgaceae bacterium]